MGLFGLRPWRCRQCEARFYGWTAPAALAWRVHCLRCGNFDLERIARKYVEGRFFTPLLRALGVPAYRCEPCRLKFFSLRPFRRIVPADEESKSEFKPIAGESPEQTN